MPPMCGLIASIPTNRCRCLADAAEMDQQGACLSRTTLRISSAGEQGGGRARRTGVGQSPDHPIDQSAHRRTTVPVRAARGAADSRRTVLFALFDSVLILLRAAAVAHPFVAVAQRRLRVRVLTRPADSRG